MRPWHAAKFWLNNRAVFVNGNKNIFVEKLWFIEVEKLTRSQTVKKLKQKVDGFDRLTTDNSLW